MENDLLFYIIIGIICIQFVIDFILDYLNAKQFNTDVPHELADVFESEEVEKSRKYKKANYRFGIVNDSFSFLLTLAFLVFGGFEWLDTFIRNQTEIPILQALLFFGVLVFGSSIASLPLSYYKTFIIEEHYGFNKTTKLVFITDLIKGWLMTAVLGGALLAMVIWLLQLMGPRFWLYTWGVFTVLMVVINLFYSKLIVPLFNKQKPLAQGSLKTAIETYAQKVGFELQNIFVIDGSKRSTKANAYFSGFGSQKRVTLFDTLINDLDEDEIVAVLAHEVGHYKRKHVVFNLLASTILMGLTLFLLSLFVNNPQLSLAIGVTQPSFHAALIGFALLYSPISTLTGLVMNQLSRTFEFQADDFAKDTFAAAPLVSSLKKLSKNSLSNLTPHPAYVFVHYSHPPLVQRIRNLLN